MVENNFLSSLRKYKHHFNFITIEAQIQGKLHYQIQFAQQGNYLACYIWALIGSHISRASTKKLLKILSSLIQVLFHEKPMGNF